MSESNSSWSRGYKNRIGFDARVLRTLRTAAAVASIRLEPQLTRQVLLHGPRERILVEYEDQPPSLERLHHTLLQQRKVEADRALLVASDRPFPPSTRDALRWACGATQLAVVPLTELYPHLLDLLTEARP